MLIGLYKEILTDVNRNNGILRNVNKVNSLLNSLLTNRS